MTKEQRLGYKGSLDAGAGDGDGLALLEHFDLELALPHKDVARCAWVYRVPEGTRTRSISSR